MDYYSRDLEIAHLSSTSTVQVINRLKAMFVRWGIPLELVSDNGPQFTSGEFKDFSEEYGFAPTTPRRTVQQNGLFRRPSTS